MKKMLRYLLLFLLVSSIIFPALAEKNESITIAFTHDMHDNLESFNMEVDGKVESRGGFSRLYSAIEKEREKDKDLLLVDAGDYSMGTLYQTIYTTHSPALRLMGRMGYDAVTFGNHEYDFRPQGLSQSLLSALDSGERLPLIVASNTQFPEEDSNQGLQDLEETFDKFGVKDYAVIEKKGIKIGILGLMGEEADSNAPMAEVTFQSMIEESKRVVGILKNEENVDLIVALSHAGTDGKRGKSEDELLAKDVPEIDIIISGHSHTELSEPIIIGSTIIASSGRYGENLGLMEIVKDQKVWKLKDYKIKPIDDRYQANTEIEATIENFKIDVENEYLDRFDLKYDEVIARSPFNFTPSLKIGDIQEEEPLGHLIGAAYKYAVKKAEGENYEPIDVAVVPSGVIRDSFTKGDITVRDIFKVSPLGIGKDKISGYPLIDVYLTGKELKTAAEVDASIQPLMTSAQLYMEGLKYSFNPNRVIFNKLTDISLLTETGEKELEDDTLYRVVANLYTAQMLNIVGDQSKGLLTIVPKDKDGQEVENFEDRIIYDNEEELKEWVALTQFLRSFPEKDGLPTIDESYAQKQGLKIVNNDKTIKARLENPNKISIAIIGILAFVIIVLITLIVFFRKRKKLRKRNRLFY
nr:bifunctional UDP-sugar hydrolase/5'-nucleotidase [Tissierella sp.]